MEDIERYGDYNEIDEAPGGNKNPVATLLKALVIFLCILVVGVILFRVILFSYYPRSIKTIHYNETLLAYRAANGGEVDALTQTMRAPYDDPDFASFMADNLIIVRGAGQLQFSIRYNSSIFDTIEQKYGVRLDENSKDLFVFELERDADGKNEWTTVGELTYSENKTSFMYTYYKLVFDGIEFTGNETHDWIRVKITIKDMPTAEPYYILVYENTEEHTNFVEYKA